jgi:hypothetical protein
VGKVILYRGITYLDLPADRILEDAMGKNLEGVVIIGFDKDGEEFFTSTYADGSTVLWLLERCKLKLLQVEIPDED